MDSTHASPMLILILFQLLFMISSSADPYGNPSPPAPPPSAVAGKDFPPQSFLCNDPLTKCSGQNLTCPSQCPSFKPADPQAKACIIDCNSPKCEAYCKNRTANCNGMGSACGDPRFVGGDGIVFYFHGKSNQYFSLFHRRCSQQGRQWDDNVDQLEFSYDNKPFLVSEGHLSSWAAPDSGLVVERTAKYNGITVTLPGVVEISANAVPVTKEDDRIHNYQIPADDCFAHLEVQFRFFHLSDRVEGVLGQTYRPEFQNPVKRGVAMPIMGGEHKYITSSLTSAACSYCIFSPQLSSSSSSSSSAAKHLALLEPTSTMECTSKMQGNGAGVGVVCRR
ncbi:hypothetical protein F0562_033085 [Nyssa sinensis]|uniref:Root cap n=1 Tax=Nyssa sinensis TaxID=561372 RepID=A0A5J5AUI0_9ASTE|nr:hypothetical protein F0562_033085 [Nyssa sinensis]